MPKATGETEAHRRLKHLAFRWARGSGLRLAAMEVTFPHRRLRFDVAAFKPARRVPADGLPEKLGVTAIFECKQARSDLVRDNARRKETGAQLLRLFERKAELESLLKVHLPHLARGETLFPELDFYSFDHLRHDGYQQTLRLIRVAQNKLQDGVKFDRLAGYRLANLHYIVTAPAIVEEHEIPLGWGWLTGEGDGLALRRPPTWCETTLGTQLIFLQRLAAAGAAAIAKSLDQISPGPGSDLPGPR